MVTILPIKGVRYNQAAGLLYSDLITPPYDIISEQEQELFYQKSPYNIIRLEYGKSLPGDNEQNNRYTRAAFIFKAWLAENILIQEKEEAIYLYEQDFFYKGRFFTRQALFCGVKLTPFSRGEIIPHEETMAKPKADRLKLLQHCEANFSPVFGLFQDPELVVEKQSRQIKDKQEPVLTFEDGEKQRHKLWAIYDREFIKLTQFFFKDKHIYIADGHHRYETSLQFYEEKKKTSSTPEPYSHTLMALVNLYDAGLLTLPTHRLVISSKLNEESLLKALARNFAITEIPAPGDSEQLEKLLDHNLKGLQENWYSFGLYTEGQRFFILKIGENAPQIKEKHLFPWIDTMILQELVFTEIFGLAKSDIRNKSCLRYTQEAWEAKKTIDRKEARFAFFMNRPSLEEIVSLAEKGVRLPQKSTYFHPKFVTGLVINKLSV